ncbi:hypothetical protein ACOMHN_004235 [Nucella lapillus]
MRKKLRRRRRRWKSKRKTEGEKEKGQEEKGEEEEEGTGVEKEEDTEEEEKKEEEQEEEKKEEEQEEKQGEEVEVQEKKDDGDKTWKNEDADTKEKLGKIDSPAWTEIKAMGAVTTQSQGGSRPSRGSEKSEKPEGAERSEGSEWFEGISGVNPAVWISAGTALGLGMAVVWNVLYRRHYGDEAQQQHTGDLVQDITQAITDLFQNREMDSHLQNCPRDDERRIRFTEPDENRNDSLSRRMKRLRRQYRRKKRRERRRRRRRRRHHHDNDSSSPPSSSQTMTGGSSPKTPLEIFSSNTKHALDLVEDTDRPSAKSAYQLKMLKRSLKRDRRKRKLKRGKKGQGRNWERSGSPAEEEEEGEGRQRRLRFDSSDGLSSQTTETTTSESTAADCGGGSGQFEVDNVQPDRLTWDDSDEYSEAHSLGTMRSSGSHSTCSSSLREEFTGPWVSTSLSFVVYDLDVIDDIPDEVLEVLSCDQKPCETHPHDRYHYVGSKIIVQRLPLPEGANEQDPCHSYLPHLQLSALSTVTTTSDPAGCKETAPKKRVRIADETEECAFDYVDSRNDPQDSEKKKRDDPAASVLKPKEERVFVSSACNTDVVDMADHSVQTVSMITTVSLAVSTEQVDTAESSVQTSVETTESSQQTSGMDNLVSAGVNTDILDVVDSSVQASCHLVSAAVNTESLEMIDQAHMCNRTTENLTETSMNTEPIQGPDVISSASNTESVDVVDYGHQALQEPEKLTTDSFAQTHSKHSMPQPLMELPEQHNVSTQTSPSGRAGGDHTRLSSPNSEKRKPYQTLSKANSSFMDESDVLSTAESRTVRYCEFASDFINEDEAIFSVKPRFHNTDRVKNSEGHQVSIPCLAAENLMLAQECYGTEVISVSDVPIAGSTDVMSQFWKPVAKKHSSWAHSMAKSPDSQARQAEMLHLTDVGSQLRFYGRCAKRCRGNQTLKSYEVIGQAETTVDREEHVGTAVFGEVGRLHGTG